MQHVNFRSIVKPFRIRHGKGFRLGDIKPGETREQAVTRQVLRDGVRRLSELPERLCAQDRWSVLLVCQAIDAAGKDSAIEHDLSGVNNAFEPWIVVPANKKWFARWVVAAAIIDALDALDLKFPTVTAGRRRELKALRETLAS